MGGLKAHGCRRFSFYFASFNVRNGLRPVKRPRWLEKSYAARYIRGKVIK